MNTYIFLPPLPRGSGGCAVLRRMGLFLHQAGFPVRFALREAGPEQDMPVESVLWQNLNLQADDIWLVPEGWPGALVPGLAAQARCLIYVQNWAYLLSCLPPGVPLETLPLDFLAVSTPVAWFIKQSLGKRAEILRPGIDLNLFCTPEKDLEAPVRGPLRVAFMPRKNKALARQIREFAEARLRRCVPTTTLKWICIEQCTQEQVAAYLQDAHIFLCTGFP